jgi:hypothetical protein
MVLVILKDVAVIQPSFKVIDKASHSQSHSRLELVENTLGKITESVRKEMQIQQEKLTSYIEELQSKNEELTTTKGENQSHDVYWFLVRALPHKTIDGVVLSVVLTINDTIASKVIEKKLRKIQIKTQGDLL